MMTRYLPHVLLAVYLVEFAIAGVAPYSRKVWYIENGPIVLLVAVVVMLYNRGVRFSNVAYVLMFVLPFLHTIGGYYTFELVPFDWFNRTFGFSRNMFDRVAHYSVGFYALPIAEYLTTRRLVSRTWVAVSYAIFTIAFVAVFYEWIEWWYAAADGGSAGAAFLGSQGDIWDAQKDMLMDVLGAVTVMAGYLAFKRRPATST